MATGIAVIFYSLYCLLLRHFLETKSFANDGCAVYEEPQLKSHDHDYIEIRLLKGVNKGLGINIGASQVAVLGSNIVVEEIMKDGPAHLDGKLMRGEIVLTMDSQ